jgi:hypothetical protein
MAADLRSNFGNNKSVGPHGPVVHHPPTVQGERIGNFDIIAVISPDQLGITHAAARVHVVPRGAF